MHDSVFLQILSRAGISTWVTVSAMSLLSIGVWTLLIQKGLAIRKMKRLVGPWTRALRHRMGLQEMVKVMKTVPDASMSQVLQSAISEIESLSQFVSYESLEARGQLVTESIDRSVDMQKDANERGMAFLAFCAATGPLIGLLGTVWGIMDTFYQIGKQGSANITVVGPGIAEALMAVLSGLLVAIPASLGFNAFANFNRQTESQLYTFGSEVVSAFKRGDLLALERATRT